MKARAFVAPLPPRRRDPEDKYDGVEALQACSGYLLRQLTQLTGSTDAAIDVLRARADSR